MNSKSVTKVVLIGLKRLQSLMLMSIEFGILKCDIEMLVKDFYSFFPGEWTQFEAFECGFLFVIFLQL